MADDAAAFAFSAAKWMMCDQRKRECECRNLFWQRWVEYFYNGAIIEQTGAKEKGLNEKQNAFERE